MEPTRHALITGSSTGIGRATALHLAARGWTVHAGVRKPADAESLRTAAAGTLVPIQLDVTDQSSIASAAAAITDRTGPDGLAALVNNAGIGIGGPVEVVPLTDWQRQFDVNFFGHIAVTQALLPLLRARTERTGPGSARIVMVSSIAGRLGQPILGPYCASKFALEAMSDALRIELRPQGIGVSVVQPGAVKSEIWRKAFDLAAAADLSDPRAQRYRTMIEAMVALAQRSEKSAIDASRAASVIERCLTARRAPARVLVGPDAKAAAALAAILPTRTMDWLLAKAFAAAG